MIFHGSSPIPEESKTIQVGNRNVTLKAFLRKSIIGYIRIRINSVPSFLKLSLIKEIEKVAQKAGFLSVDTPALEYSEVLLGVGGETDKQVFRFTDQGGRDVS